MQLDPLAPAVTPGISSEWREGWPVVLAAMIGFGCSLGMFAMSAGLFISPMRAEFGWSMSEAAFAPVVILIIAVMMPFGGAAVDHFGSRKVALFGLCLFASAYLALALLPLNLPTLCLVAGCLGLLGPAGNSGPYVRGVATWFRRHTGSAFGVTMAGTSLVGAVVVPGVALIIGRFGWRGGYLAMAGFILIVAIPMVAWLFHEKAAVVAPDPNSTMAEAGQSLREALADRRFWLLTLAFSLAALPMGAFLAHLQPMLRSLDFDLPTAALCGSLFALAIGIGRIGGGLLIDRIWAYGVAAFCIALAAFGCFLMPSLGPQHSTWLVGSAIMAIGLSYGAEVDFAAYFSLRLFGLRDFSKIFGCIALVLGGGVAIGGMLSSALFDWTGSYALLGPISGCLFLLSAATILMMGLWHGRTRKR